MRDPIPRPEPRLRRRRARLRRAAGPRRWKAGQHRVAPELAALVVTRPRAGVELLPLITLLGEDLAAKLDPLGRKLAKKDRKSTRLNSSHSQISYAVFCLKKKHRDT